MVKELCLLAGGVMAGGFLRSQYERDHFVVEETVIESEKIRKNRILIFLSDLHNKEFGKDNQRLHEAIDQINPDAVLIGGDTMVTRPADKIRLEVTAALVKRLVKHYPVYYANGNHEQRLAWEPDIYGSQYQELCRFLRKNGAIHLSDRSALLGEDIRISGLNIDKNYYQKFSRWRFDEKYIEKRLGKADQRRYQILLAHSPMFFDACADWGADLTLSGHFHGGTIRIPFLGGVMTPQYQFFSPWCAGSAARDGKRMLISRGLGTHSINIRINDKPQVIVVRLKKSCD